MNKAQVVGYALLVVGFVFGGITFGALASTHEKDQCASQINNLKDEQHTVVSGLKIDVEAQKRLVEKAAEATKVAEAKVVKAEAEKAALKKELDADGDGIHIPTDLCPNSTFEQGGATFVHPNGCKPEEVAMSCIGAPYHPVDSTTRWVFTNCPFAEDWDPRTKTSKTSYTCNGDYDYAARTWKITDCSYDDGTGP